MENKDSKNVVVLFHAECPDGFGAAWAAWKKFGDEALYIPVHHNSEIPKGVEGKDVYTVDFSYKEDVTKSLLNQVKSLTIIDHHISNKDIVKLAHDHVFDVNHSGAVLSWQYFHPDKPVPLLLKYVEDIDIWKLELPYIKEIGEFLELVEFDFNLWSKVASEFENKETFHKYLDQGVILYKKLEKSVHKSVNNARKIEFEGYECYLVNTASYVSATLHALVGEMPPIAIAWSQRGDRMIFSLRSDGTVDVSELAKKYGGGGHKNAAGFSWKDDSFLKFQDHRLS